MLSWCPVGITGSAWGRLGQGVSEGPGPSHGTVRIKRPGLWKVQSLSQQHELRGQEGLQEYCLMSTGWG